MHDPLNDKSWWFGITIILGLLMILGLWGGLFVWIWFNRDSVVTTGQAGDTFGVLNALFSGLSSFGVIVAIFLQRQELHEQRIELRQSRIAQEQSASAMQGQLRTAQLQSEIIALTEIIPLLDTLVKRHAKFSHLNQGPEDPIQVAMVELREESIRYEALLLNRIREHFKASKQS